MQQKIEEILVKIERIEILLENNFQKEYLNAKEAAVYLNISTNYLYKLTSYKKFPFYKPSGKLIYFKRRELDDWIFSGRIKSTTEIDSEAISIVINKRK